MTTKMMKDTTYTKIFVGGLPYHTTDTSLREYFQQFGDLEEAVVITDRQTSKSRGYGFVTMSDRAGAESACRDPNPIIDGRKANVNLAYLGAKPRMSAADMLAYSSFPITMKTGFPAGSYIGSTQLASIPQFIYTPTLQPTLGGGAPSLQLYPATILPVNGSTIYDYVSAPLMQTVAAPGALPSSSLVSPVSGPSKPAFSHVELGYQPYVTATPLQPPQGAYTPPSSALMGSGGYAGIQGSSPHHMSPIQTAPQSLALYPSPYCPQQQIKATKLN